MSSLDSTSDDEQLARDLQLALHLEDKEHEKESRRRRRNEKSETASCLERDGFCAPGNLNNADHMLYVPCHVDGRAIELLVDSGASSSAISSAMLARLGLQHKVNPAVAGAASGVGSAQILGVLENIACKIGHVEFRLYFMVLEVQVPLLILGLDQLRRFNCLIDLENNKLVFGGTNGVSVPFLSRELAAQTAQSSFVMGANDGATQAASPTFQQQQQYQAAVVGSAVASSAPASYSAPSSGGLGSLFGRKSKK
jgi:hypothetical protein